MILLESLLKEFFGESKFELYFTLDDYRLETLGTAKFIKNELEAEQYDIQGKKLADEYHLYFEANKDFLKTLDAFTFETWDAQKGATWDLILNHMADFIKNKNRKLCAYITCEPIPEVLHDLYLYHEERTIPRYKTKNAQFTPMLIAQEDAFTLYKDSE